MNGSGVEADEDRPWFNWYTWRCEHWNTKLNAYDGYTDEGKTSLTFVFNTAWTLVTPIVDRLPVLGYDFGVLYADEAIGSNCGILSYSYEQGWTHQDESNLKDPDKFAKNLWDKY